ncbi:ankyrin repeat domain-containing protein [Myceligenerans sp. TRM 65318]|uniref:Ankyrin repeat domain-containing protein n=1 Tax=Myceligenerans pegani TaxID=2776917 RepID=A0ABR9MVF0_9MICO|nr:ankyrin repeat domain-containing protein [Myceligenerans sp. TRM 65318]MBE3017630.1 ankyrin repeat domain-containing protein [Myceligenerans sp. TRM 65318]
MTPEEQTRIQAVVADLAREGRTAVLEQFLDRGLSADQQDSSGNSLLMLAAYHGHAETVETLLRRGADPDVCNARDQSPIAGALVKGESEIVDLLRAAGASLDIGAPTAREVAKMFGRRL